MPEMKEPHEYTNEQLMKLWKTQNVDHLPVKVRAGKPHILLRVNLTPKQADEMVKDLKKSGLKAVQLLDQKSHGYNVWVSVK
jgi:hypothetical protein